MLMELLLFLRFYLGRNPQEDLCFFLLTTACRYLNDSHYEFGKIFDARITLSPFTHTDFSGKLPVNCLKEIMCEQDLFKNTGKVVPVILWQFTGITV